MYSEVLFLALVAKLVAIVTTVDTDTTYDKILSGVLGIFSRSCSLLWALHVSPHSHPSSSIRLRQNAKQPSQAISHQKTPPNVPPAVPSAKSLTHTGVQVVISGKISSTAKSSASQRLSTSKVVFRKPTRAPVSKGYSGAFHFGDHKSCPTFFSIGNDKYSLMEDGRVFLIDESGCQHSVTEVYGGTKSYFPLGKDKRLRFNNQGLLCEWDGETEPRPLRTWCLDDPASLSPRMISGLGCFFSNPNVYHKAGCNGAGSEGCVPLNGSLHGSHLIPHSPTDVTGPITPYHNVPPIQVNWAGIGNNGAAYDSQLVVSPADARSAPVSALASSSRSPQPADETSHQAALPGPGSHASVARRTCSICFRVMRRPSALLTHLNSHKGIKPFECSVGDCDYASTTKANLERHVRGKHTSSGH
ncbi:hypothetical protein BDV93DRAFT_523137 [Ceratobasidium sp. AG-I]|nr:hypothetical protein BDV93DRAFT_523137 [Ceratobasidium sp. AG-I]